LKSIDRVKLLVKRSMSFLKYSFEALNAGEYDLAVFNADQSLQLLVKAVLLHITGYYPQIHGIRELLGAYYEVTRDDVIRDIVREYRKELVELEKAYIEAWYGLTVYEYEESRRLLEFVKKIIEYLLDKHRELAPKTL